MSVTHQCYGEYHSLKNKAHCALSNFNVIFLQRQYILIPPLPVMTASVMASVMGHAGLLRAHNRG